MRSSSPPRISQYQTGWPWMRNKTLCLRFSEISFASDYGGELDMQRKFVNLFELLCVLSGEFERETLVF